MPTSQRANGVDLGTLDTLPIVAPVADPLRHLSTLRAVAILGYDASRAVLAEPVSWLWDGIIATHHHVEAAGKSGSGKSTWAIGLAVAAANPTDAPVSFLGRVVAPIPHDRWVCIVNEENGRQSAVAHIDRWIEILGLPPREDARLRRFLDEERKRRQSADASPR